MTTTDPPALLPPPRSMTMSTHDITLPASQRPTWPDLCVGCEMPQPGHKARISVTGSRFTFGWGMEAALLATGTTGRALT